MKDEQIITHNFGCGSVGFKSVDDDGMTSDATAVCILPGTQLAVENIAVGPWFHYDKSKADTDGIAFEGARDVKDTTAVFAKRDDLGSYHDALEFADGTFLPVGKLLAGGRVRVLQMPAWVASVGQLDAAATEQRAEQRDTVEVK